MDGTGITLSGLSNDMHKEVKNRRNLLIWVKLLRDEGISFNNMAKNLLVTKLSSRKDLQMGLCKIGSVYIRALFKQFFRTWITDVKVSRPNGGGLKWVIGRVKRSSLGRKFCGRWPIPDSVGGGIILGAIKPGMFYYRVNIKQWSIGG